MKILLTNDDGYDALGINVLRERLMDDGHEVFVMPVVHKALAQNVYSQSVVAVVIGQKNLH